MRGILVAGVLALAQLLPRGAAAETIDVRITEVPYRPTVAFLHFYLEAVGPASVTLQDGTEHSVAQVGTGLRIQSARNDRDIQFDAIIGYRRMETFSLGIGKDTLGFFDIELGGRYFPVKPTFGLGTTAFRLTAGASGGLTVGAATDLTVQVNAGLTVSWGKNPSGLMLELVYRPLTQKATYFPEDDPLSDEESARISSGWTIRAGFLFGPAS